MWIPRGHNQAAQHYPSVTLYRILRDRMWLYMVGDLSKDHQRSFARHLRVCFWAWICSTLVPHSSTCEYLTEHCTSVLLVVLVPQIVPPKYVSTALGVHKSVSDDLHNINWSTNAPIDGTNRIYSLSNPGRPIARLPGPKTIRRPANIPTSPEHVSISQRFAIH